MAKAIQDYFGISTTRTEEILDAVTSAWKSNLPNEAHEDINAVKHKAFLDASNSLRATSNECGLIGILVEQCYHATKQMPKKDFWGRLK